MKLKKPISIALSLMLAAASISFMPASTAVPAPLALVNTAEAASSTSWNMGNTGFKSLGTIKSNTTVDGLTLLANSSKTMQVKSESATVNGTSFKYALALGGSGSTSYRALSAKVSGTSTIKITARSSGSETRKLDITDSKGKVLATISCGSSAALGTATINYSGNIYIYSENSGINIYKVQIDSKDAAENTTESTTKQQSKPETTTKPQSSSSSSSSASSSTGWNMSDMSFRGLGTLKAGTTVDGLELYANSSKTMQVKSENASVDGSNFSYALALGGSGSTSYRSVAANANGSTTVKVIARSSGSDTRTLNVTDSKGKVLGTLSYGSNAAFNSVNVNASGKIFIYSAGSGINIYKVQIDTTGGSSSAGSQQTTPNKESSTEATTKQQSTTTPVPSTGGSVKLTTPPSNVVAVIKDNNESALTDAIKKVNSSGGTIYIDTNEISVKSALKLSGSKAGAIVGVQRSDGTYPRLNFKPARDSGSTSRGITVSGSNQLIQNLIIENAGDNGIWVSGGKNTIEHVIARYNNDSGIQLSDNANGNTLRYCYSYRNIDVNTYGANADGFAPKLGASNTVFEYCYAWDNSDDGWDSYDKAGDKSAKVTYSHSACWNNGNPKVFTGEYDFRRGKSLDKNMWTIQQIMAADSSFANNYANGKFDVSKGKIAGKSVSTWLSSANGEMNGNGFKFGSKTTEKSTSVVRTADYCVAFDHKSKGFDNNNSEGCTGYITNCVSFNNNINYQLPYVFAKWSNNYAWSAIKSDQSKQSQSIKKPSNVSSATNSFYSVRDQIENTVKANKMPDGITFDNAIKALG